MSLIETTELITSGLPDTFTVPTTVLGLGILSIVAAVIGGGLTAFGITIPALKSRKRQWALGLLGAVLLAFGLVWSELPRSIVLTNPTSDQQLDPRNQAGQAPSNGLLSQSRPKSTDNRTSNPLEIPTPENLNKQVSPPAEEAQWAISKALDQDHLATALTLLSQLSQSKAKAEECDHVYDYALKNNRLREAASIIDECWVGTPRAQRIEEINHQYQQTAMTGENQ